MTFTRHLAAAARLLVVMTVLLGLLYPMAITAAGRAMPHRADGTLVAADGRVAGSALLGQPPSAPQWFQSRPSASEASGETSGGSNLAPGSSEQAGAVAQRAEELRAVNPDAPSAIPADALTASASGLDPDISLEYAAWQAPRVAAARGLAPDAVRRLVEEHTRSALLGFIGQDHVNVLELNVALARLDGQ